MAVDTNISYNAAKAAVDAVVGVIDGGTGTDIQVLIYAGAKPATPDDAATGLLLATIDLGTSSFGAATTGTGTDVNYAVAVATAVLPKSDTNAGNTGTAAWARCLDRDGDPVIDGTVGTATSDFIIDNTSIAVGQTVKLNEWKIRQSRGS